MRGFDEARLMRIVAERLAELANGALEHRVADEHARPDAASRSCFDTSRPGLRRQELQQRERLRRQRHRLGRRDTEWPLIRIEPEVAKGQDAIGVMCDATSRSYRILTNPLTAHDTISRARRLRITDQAAYGDSYMPFISFSSICLVSPSSLRQSCSVHRWWPARLRRRRPRLTSTTTTAAGAGRRRPACRWRRDCRTSACTPSRSSDEGRARAAVHQPGPEPRPTASITPKPAARLPRPRGSIPNCAMAYWGQALVLGPNINAPMDAGGRAEGARARAEGDRAQGPGHAARARLHRRARRALHRPGRGSRQRPTAPMPTRCDSSTQPYPGRPRCADALRRIADGPAAVELLDARRRAA